MPNFPVRFGKGGGLELSASVKTQRGLLALENAQIDLRDSVAKRSGAPSVTLTTATTPVATIAADDTRAVFYRRDELMLETKGDVYSRRECAGDSVVNQGTATSQEIQDTLDELAYIEQDEFTVDVAVSGDAGAIADAYARVDRVSEVFGIVALTDGLDDANLQFAFDGPTPKVSWTGSTTGEVEFGDGWTQPTFYNKFGTFNVAYFSLQRPSPTRPSTRSETAWYTFTLSSNTVTLDFLDKQDLVVGPLNFFAAVDGDGKDIYALTETFVDSATYRIQALVSGRVWPLGSADNAIVNASLQSNPKTLFAARGSLAGGTPVRVAFTILEGGGETNFEIRTLDLPSVPGTAADSVLFNGATMDVTSQMGISEDSLNFVVAMRPVAPVSRFAFERSVTDDLFVVDVESGDYEMRYGIGSSAGAATVTIEVLVAGETLPFRDSLPTGQPSIQRLQVRANTSGQHLLVYLDSVYTLRVATYKLLGDSRPTIIATWAATKSFASFADDTIFGYSRLLTKDVGGVLTTRQEVFWTTDLAAFNSTQTNVSSIISFDIGHAMSLSLSPLLGSEASIRATQWGNDPGSPSSYRRLYSYTLDSGTGAKTVRDDSLGTIAGSPTAAHLQLGAFPRIIWAFKDSPSGVVEVYEIDTDLFVRVLPTTTSLAAGNWTRRGPWTRARLAVTQAADWGEVLVRQTSSASVTSAATGDPCVLSLSDIGSGANQGINAVIYSTHAESGGPASPVVLEALARAPHAVNCTDSVLALSYVNTLAQVLYQFWSPGVSFTSLSSGITAHSASAPVMDLSGSSYGSATPYYVMATRDGADDTVVQIREETGGAVVLQFISNMVNGPAEAIAVYAIPDPTLQEPAFLLAQASSGVSGVNIHVKSYVLEDSTEVLQWEESWSQGEGGDLAFAITTGALESEWQTDGLVSVEWIDVGTGERQVDTFGVEDAAHTLIKTNRLASVYGSYVEFNEQMVFALSDTPTQISGRLFLRNGIYVLNPITGEYVSRIDNGLVEEVVSRAGQRTQVSDFNRYLDTQSLTLGYQVSTGAVLEALTASRFAEIDFVSRPNNPAVAQGVLVGAHAGYPRAYDGVSVFEHDWHQLPQILGTTLIGGGLVTGNYSIAVTYEVSDSEGILYRAQPDFVQVNVPAGPSGFDVDVRSLTLTERRDVRAVAWRTLVGGTTYHRTAEALVSVDADTITIPVVASDSAIAQNPTLDQVAGGTLPGQRGAVTDWMAYADGRLWSRDPQRSSLLRFSIPVSEGFSPHWNVTQGIELPSARKATGVAEADGRIVAWTPAEANYFSVGGPDGSGLGAYRSASLIPSSTGASEYPTISLIPDGLVYGSGNMPFILSRGLSTEEYADAIYAPWEVSGESLVTSVWRPDFKESVLSNGATGRSFRLHPATVRWCEDTSRPAKDQAVSSGREYVVLCEDGRLLVDRPGAVDPYTDGGTPYRFRVSTPWIHTPSRDLLIHGHFSFQEVTLWGQYLGAHELQLRVYLDYSDTPAHSMVVTAAQTAANDAAGIPYLYNFHPSNATDCHSLRVEVSDNTEPNATFRLEGLDISLAASEPGARRLPPSQLFVSPQ